jgi:LysM repeat protein
MSFKDFKSIAFISCFILATTFSASALPLVSSSKNIPSEIPKESIHTVGKGETIYSIARLYNISVNDLYTANSKSELVIKVGDKLKIPATSTKEFTANKNTTTYTTKSKETLYSIAKQYGIRVDDIIENNPNLKSKPLTDGQVLNIPTSSTKSETQSSKPSPSTGKYLKHKVEPKETIYGIARLYSTSTEAIINLNPETKDGLKEGSTILIPTSVSSITQTTAPIQTPSTISIGVILPFVNKSNSQSARFVEYHEGFLIALEEMKAKGLSANVYIFDMGSETGTERLNSLLETNELKYLDLIVGGVSSEQISTISNFAKKQGIKYAIPFPNRNEEVLTNPYIYQINTSHQTLYANASKSFVNLFQNANIIYINEPASKGDRADFISVLNQELTRYGMRANNLEANQSLTSNLTLALDYNRKNVIVPTSGSTKILQSILPSLQSISTQHPDFDISLFGHTNWQTYTQHYADFAAYNTYIYTPFYFDESNARSTQFVNNYKKWFDNKSFINTYPKYAVLGYDTGITLLTALLKYGKDFDGNANATPGSSLQTPFLFRKTGQSGGYFNNGFYFVNYKKDGSIVKTEYGK